MKSPELSWKEAILRVLSEASGPLHYREIAELVVRRGYRRPSPSASTTVNTVLNSLLKKTGTSDQLVKFGRGYYVLKGKVTVVSSSESFLLKKPIQVYGRFWSRSKVLWRLKEPQLKGRTSFGEEFDAYYQVGLYVLHELNEVIYIGSSVNKPLGECLYRHTRDHLSSRWSMFSWFGFRSIEDLKTGEPFDPAKAEKLVKTDLKTIISVLESVLVDVAEPRQNMNRQEYSLEAFQEEP